MTPFGAYLTELLAARQVSLRAFAARVGVDPSAVVYAKRTRIAKQRIGPWADALGLTGAQRERFEFLAWCTHTPPLILERLRALEEQVGSTSEP
jgi:hypothetical protein